MAITTQWLSGAETGLLGACVFTSTAGGITVVSTAPRNGSYHFQLAAAAAATNGAVPVTGTPAKIVMRFGVRVTSLPTAGQVGYLAQFVLTSGAIGSLQVDSAGQLSIVGLSSVGVAAGAAPSWSTYHLIEIQVDVASGAQIVRWKIDGVVQNVATTVATTIASARIGTATAQTFTAYVDDFILGTWTNQPTDWYGDGQVLAIQPGADGTHSTVTSFAVADAGAALSGTVTTANGNVKKTVPWTATRSTTLNLSQLSTTGGASAYMEIAPTTTALTGVPNGVRTILAHSGAASTLACTAACVVLNGDAVSSTVYGTLAAPGAAWTSGSTTLNIFKAAMVTAPGAGWSAAAINALRWRFGGSNDISPRPTLQALLLEVDWPIVVTPPAENPPPDVNQAIYTGRGW